MNIDIPLSKIKQFIFLTCILYCHSLYGLSFNPFINSMYENNDNFNLATSNMSSFVSSYVNTGFSINNYVSPEVYTDIGYAYETFNIKKHGDYITSSAYGLFHYLLLPQVIIGGYTTRTDFQVTKLSDKDYNANTFQPFAQFFITPYTRLEIYFKVANYKYTETGYNIHQEKNGLQLEKDIFSWLTLNGNVEQSKITNSEGIDAYKTLNFGSGATLYLFKNQKLSLKGYQSIYTKLSTKKIFNNDFSLNANYTFYLNKFAQFSLNYYMFKEEKIKTKTVNNNLITGALTLNFPLGSPYKSFSTKYDYYLSESSKARLEQNYVYAEKLLSHLSLVYPKNPTILHELAISYHEQSKYDLAIKTFEKALILDETDLSNYYFLAHNYLQKGNDKKALSILEILSENTNDNYIKKLINLIKAEE